jgi:RNA polymerase sigma-70 factor (ECF subfamily)
MTPPVAPDPAFTAAVQHTWHRFLDVYEPLRPDLYRYCRYLTDSAWDAEDLVQDALGRAFVTLGRIHGEVPPNPRAWLFRVASNLWIDRTRRRRREVLGDVPEAETAAVEPIDPHAVDALVGRLAPQERAAVVLKDVFDLSLAEVAEALGTSVGAVKAALHRGRGRLADPTHLVNERRAAAPPAVIAAFCDAFNAGDLTRLTALLLDTSMVEIDGLVTEYGPAATAHPSTGSLFGMMHTDLSLDDPRGGIDARWRDGVRGSRPRLEPRWHRDDWTLLFWYGHEAGDAVRAVARIEVVGDHIGTFRNYFYTPDVIAEACREMGVPYRTNGYRYWSPAPITEAVQ